MVKMFSVPVHQQNYTSSSCLIPHIYGVNIHSKYLYKYEVKYKVLLRAFSAGNTVFHCIFTQPRAHLLQSPVQGTLKFSPAQEHICLIISLSRPTFRPCYLTDMQRDDVKQGNKGLTLTELALMILTSSTSHQHCTHYSVHTPHILRGNMYSHGYYVVTLWDRSWERVGPKLCGFYADNQLLGCGDYVDFVPRKLPHIVCPAIVQQHRKSFRGRNAIVMRAIRRERDGGKGRTTRIAEGAELQC